MIIFNKGERIMKNNIKSILIGFLSATCIFLLMGYTSNSTGEFETLKVKDLQVENINVSGYISLYDEDYDAFTMIGSTYYSIYSVLDDENPWAVGNNSEAVFIGRSTDRGGLVQVNNKYGDVGCQLLGKGYVYETE